MLSKYCTLIEESIYVDYIMIISNPKVNRAGFQTSNAVTECIKNVEQLAAVGWIFRSLSLSTVIVGQSIYAKLWLNPPQMATEAFSSDLLPERSPEKHIKNVETSRRANIFFSKKSKMAVKNITWSIIQ